MPPDQHNPRTGFFLTVEKIFDTVEKIDEKLDSQNMQLRDEISKLKVQLSAQWVVHGIMIAAIIGMVTRGIGQ